MAGTDVFKHSTPEPERILETAAGAGIVTRAVNEALPDAEVVVTDINPALVAFAAQRLQSARITFHQADAQQLPFDDESFDVVLCLFGIMFFSRQGPCE